MSNRAQTAVKLDSGSVSNTRLFLIMLADYADDWGICWPGLETLADDTKLNERTIRRQIERLEELGEIITFRRRRQSTVYVLNLPSLAPINDEAKAKLKGALGSYPQILDRTLCPRTTRARNVQGTKRNRDLEKSLTSVDNAKVDPKVLSLATRMSDACKYPDVAAAVAVVTDLAAHVDLRVVDEAIGYTLDAEMETQPRNPAYFRTMLTRWASQRGIRVAI